MPLLRAFTLLLLTLGSAHASQMTDEQIQQIKAKTGQQVTPFAASELHKATNLGAQGKYREALAKAANIQGRTVFDRAMINLTIGTIFYSMKDKNQLALKHLQLAFDSKALNYEQWQATLQLIGQLHVALKNWQQGIDHFKLWMRVTGNETSGIHVNFASAWLGLNQPEKALQAANRAVELNKDKRPDLRTWHFKARAHSQLEQYAEAAKAAEILTLLRPDHAQYHINYGLYHFKAKQYPQAIKALTDAKDWGFVKTDRQYLLLARAYKQNGEMDKAIALVEQRLADKNDKTQGKPDNRLLLRALEEFKGERQQQSKDQDVNRR